MFHPWKPSAQSRISPTPTLQLQYSRCSWQCIMKIGRETCYPLPWRAFKSWINFFLPPPLNHCRFFIRSSHLCACVCVCRAHAQVHTDVERWRKDRRRVFRFTIFRQLSFSFPFSRREREREGNIAGIFFIDGDLLLLLFSSSGVDLIFFFFFFSALPETTRDFSWFKRSVERGNLLDENGQLTSLNL